MTVSQNDIIKNNFYGRQYCNLQKREKFAMNVNERTIRFNSFMWNAIVGVIQGFQSIIILAVLSNYCDQLQAGIYSISFAVANLVLIVGKYGVRFYQASDISEGYHFLDYLRIRVFTTGIMIVSGVCYSIYGFFVIGYSLSKMLIMIFFCLLLSIDSIEDVFQGHFHRDNRLDIASKTYAVRLLFSLGLLVLCLIITKNLLISSIVVYLCSVIFSFMIQYKLYKKITIFRRSKRNELRILKDCTPLFLVVFCQTYLNNASKFSLDKYMSDEVQVVYTYLIMPTLAINLLCTFIYQPLVGYMTTEWRNKNIKRMFVLGIEQFVLAALCALIAIVVMQLGGVELLSDIFRIELCDYEREFSLLFVGGGLFAWSTYLVVSLTIMRYQKQIMLTYICVSVIVSLLAKVFVVNWGMIGATALYMLSMLAVALSLTTIWCWGIRKEKGVT